MASPLLKVIYWLGKGDAFVGLGRNVKAGEKEGQKEQNKTHAPAEATSPHSSGS